MKQADKCVALRAKSFSYLIDEGSKYKKTKGTKAFVIKRNLNVANYENYLDTTQLENKINHLGKKMTYRVLKKS